MRTAIVGPVFPFRAGIAYCTTRLAEELKADVGSYKRQYPRRFYPGGDDIDPTLPRAKADFILDIVNPITWIRAGLRLRKYDAVIFVWWIWVWAIPVRAMMAMLSSRTLVILQCHNIGDKEPAWWKSADEYRKLADELGLAVVPSESEGSGRVGSVTVPPAAQVPRFARDDMRRVRFDFRFIPDAEIATWFAACDVVLAPYRIEAQSGVALTAFHFARPVIASTVGGLPEIIDGQNGILIPPEDPAALAAAVDEFFTARDRAGMERAAAATARKYSWPEYAKVFEGLVSGR